jgi:hypothetical protein
MNESYSGNHGNQSDVINATLILLTTESGCNPIQVLTILFLVLVCVAPPIIIFIMVFYWYKSGSTRYIYGTPMYREKPPRPRQVVRRKMKPTSYNVVLNTDGYPDGFPECEKVPAKKPSVVRFA